MNVYAVKWVQAGDGPLEYNPHISEVVRTDLHGIDFITCSTDRQAYMYVSTARPLARVDKPFILGPANI